MATVTTHIQPRIVAEAESQGTRDLNRAHSSLYDDRVDLNDQEFGGNFAWVMEKVQAVQVLAHGIGYNIVNRVHILARTSVNSLFARKLAREFPSIFFDRSTNPSCFLTPGCGSATAFLDLLAGKFES